MVNKCSAGKENVPLALTVMHETTIAAARSYFPNQRDVANFLEMFNTRCTISNSEKRFSPNMLEMLLSMDSKNFICVTLADYIEQWCQPSQHFNTRSTLFQRCGSTLK